MAFALAAVETEEVVVTDLIYVLLTVGFFALCWGYVRISDKL